MRPTQTELPSQIPVMVLGRCNLLPHGLLPLYIFEPRYREMLAESLEGDRMFAIGTPDPNSVSGGDDTQIFEYSCAGLVRACVEGEDGASHLVLQGLQRIRFTGWVDDDKPFRTALIEPVATRDSDPAASAALAKRAVGLARELSDSGLVSPSARSMEEIEAVTDPEAVADLIAYHLIRNPEPKQRLLGITEVGERLRFVIDHLANAGPSLP